MVKESACNVEDARDTGSIPGSGKAPGGGHGNPHQYYCLESPRDRGYWRPTVHRVSKRQTWLEWLSTAQHGYFIFAVSSLSYSTSISSGPQAIRICHLLSHLVAIIQSSWSFPFFCWRFILYIVEFLSTIVLTPFLRTSAFICTDYLTTWPLKSLTSLHPIICSSRFIP